MNASRRPPDRSIVIFGASGDLTSRKLMPALYALHCTGQMPNRWKVVGYSRTAMSDDEFRRRMRAAVQSSTGRVDAKHWRTFASRLAYVSGGFAETHAMDHLERELKERDAPPPRLFYCATPPSAFPDIVRRLGETGLTTNARIVVEKPFGRDLASARRLNRLVHRVFDEEQVFRIDHYLGKETVQNILVFRFANGMFEPIWNRRYVQRVEITVAESLGVEGRGAFYEEAGALRDIVQNHVLQVLTFLAMEPPVSFEPEPCRDEKAKVLSGLRKVDRRDVVRGQYRAGRVARKAARAYRDEPGVSRTSDVETYVAMRMWIDTWRWAGVPFLLRTGKRLPRRVTEITMTFHDAPHALFPHSPSPNHLTIRIQPNEGICLTFDAKAPGPRMHPTPVEMNFNYAERFRVNPAEAYQRLLHDAMNGDHTLFPRADEVELAWQALGPALRRPTPLRFYKSGTWGPAEAERLAGASGWQLK